MTCHLTRRCRCVSSAPSTTHAILFAGRSLLLRFWLRPPRESAPLDHGLTIPSISFEPVLQLYLANNRAGGLLPKGVERAFVHRLQGCAYRR